MENELKVILRREDVQNRFKEILHKKANGFTANLAVIVNNDANLRKCEPFSIISAAIISASLDLPVDPNLGYAALVPYNEKQADGKYLPKATFQMMYKGFVQLAMRTGLYTRIGVTEIYEGQLISENPLTGEYEFDFSKKSETIVGYAAYFKLGNGFSKTEYWPIDKVTKHGKRFSQTFKKNYGLWVDDFDSMAKKTVLKTLLAKWGVLSIELQTAVKFDQAVVTEDIQPVYIDNDDEQPVDLVLKPTHKDWERVKESVQKKHVSIEQLHQKYEIDKETEKLLKNGK